MRKSLLAAVFAVSGMLMACGGAESPEAVELEQASLATREDKLTGNETRYALEDITRYAPKSLPSNTPESLLNVTIGGKQYNLRELIARTPVTDNHTPHAYITAVFRTGPTVASPAPFGNLSPLSYEYPEPDAVTLYPEYTRSAPAAQVYECRANGSGGYAWTFIRPEASLIPVTTQPIRYPQTVSFDHFRYPGGINYWYYNTGTPPAGPSWRLIAPAYSEGLPSFGQQIFVGAVDASAPNGTANIPLLRVRNAGKVDNYVFYTLTRNEYSDYGYVLRLNTQGGLAPTSGCATAADAGKQHRSPYSTDYYFVQVRSIS